MFVTSALFLTVCETVSVFVSILVSLVTFECMCMYLTMPVCVSPGRGNLALGKVLLLVSNRVMASTQAKNKRHCNTLEIQ